ncbi:hypothetical protein C5167_029504 [Papaver somniferum]|nr:hypothetical protein C5167_029504 [Papaver somniferum]
MLKNSRDSDTKNWVIYQKSPMKIPLLFAKLRSFKRITKWRQHSYLATAYPPAENGHSPL